MAGDEKQKISVKGTSSDYSLAMQDEITMALLQNGAVKRIQNTFQQRLDEAGWSQNLREYVERLFRSGDATTYEDAIKIVSQHIKLQPEAEAGMKTNGSGEPGVPDLTIPRDAAKDAAELVKKELAKVTKMDK